MPSRAQAIAIAPSRPNSSDTLPDTVSTESIRLPGKLADSMSRTRSAAALAAPDPPSGLGSRIW